MSKPDDSDLSMLEGESMPLPILVVRCTIGGVLMGLANLVPGISGGTMLLAAGVYPTFIGAIAELSESFGAEAAPMVVNVEGQERRLTGTAQAQYEGWRRLLKDIYKAETGFTEQIDVGAPARTTESATAE